MSETPSADGLVTSTESTGSGQTKRHDAPATDVVVNPDPAHVLDPINAEQKVTAPRERGKRKRTRRAAPAVRAKRVKSVDEAKDSKANATEFHGNAAAQLAKATREEGRAAYAAAVAHEAAGGARLKGALTLRLASAKEFIDGQIEVAAEDLKAEGKRVLYMKAIDIGPDGPVVHVDEAWLIDEHGDAACCELCGGLSGGGGAHAQIPAGHLAF